MTNTEAKIPGNPSEENVLSVGEMLRAAREAKGLSIEQLVRDLRIESAFLIALEQDDFETLSAPVFTKGYMRQYSQRVGLEYEHLLKQYNNQVGSRDIPMTSSRPIRLDSGKRFARWISLMLFLALLAAGGWVWHLYFDGPLFVEAITSIENDSDFEINSVAVKEPLVVDFIDVSSAPANFLPTLANQLVVPSIEKVQLESYVEVGNEEDLRSMPSEPTARVEIAFDQDCWTEITDVHGERFYYDLGRAGRMSIFDAHFPLSFLLGNASGVQIRINGDAYLIPVNDYGGNVARFVITEAS
jgi:cytoskeleton protein RodZ